MLVVLSGPSGVGKDTLLNCLKTRGYDFAFVVTMTTRQRRANEVEGVDYLFVSKGEFADLMQNDELLEHSIVYGDYKGIPKSQVRQAFAVWQRCHHADRCAGRGENPHIGAQRRHDIYFARKRRRAGAPAARRATTESEDSLKIRIATAREEMKRKDEFEYLVINQAGAQDDAVDQIVSIISAEHCRIGRHAPRI